MDNTIRIATQQNEVAEVGEWSLAIAAAEGSLAVSHGAGSVVMGFNDSYASGKMGNALLLVEKDATGSIVSVFSGIVGQGGLKPDTLYSLVSGALVEHREQVETPTLKVVPGEASFKIEASSPETL